MDKSIEQEIEDQEILAIAADTWARRRTLAFDAAAKSVTDERGEVYGHPYTDFDRAARLKAVVAECDDPRIRHVLDMICVKMARLIHSPDHLDSWIDIAGYSRTAVMCLDRDEVEKQREGPD
jgi:hypothetical protein